MTPPPSALATPAQGNTSTRSVCETSAKTSPGVIKPGAQPLRIPKDVSRKAQIDKTMVCLTSLPRGLLVFIISLWMGLKPVFQRAVAGSDAPKVTDDDEDRLFHGGINRRVKNGRAPEIADKEEGLDVAESESAKNESGKNSFVQASYWTADKSSSKEEAEKNQEEGW
jgi:hypothetical protein